MKKQIIERYQGGIKVEIAMLRRNINLIQNELAKMENEDATMEEGTKKIEALNEIISKQWQKIKTFRDEMHFIMNLKE